MGNSNKMMGGRGCSISKFGIFFFAKMLENEVLAKNVFKVMVTTINPTKEQESREKRNKEGG